MVRQAFISILLGLVASLHVYTTTRADAIQSRDGKIRPKGEVSSGGTRLADISSCEPGSRITVRGTVGDLWKPVSKRAPHTLILRDQSGALEVVHWLENPLGIEIGSFVECSGTVDLYRGQLQLRLWRKGDLTLRVAAESVH